jgi:hypothetical protein
MAVAKELTKAQGRRREGKPPEERRPEAQPNGEAPPAAESAPEAGAPTRAGWRARLSGAGVLVGAAGAGRGAVRLVARLVSLATGIVAAIIVVTILFKVLEANRDNSVVSDAFDISKKLVGPMADIFNLQSRKAEVAVNYGLAAAVYVVAGQLVARTLRRIAP